MAARRRSTWASAQALDAQLERSFPRRHAADAAVSLGSETQGLDMVGIARRHAEAEHELLQRQVSALLKRPGLHTRAMVRELPGPKARPAEP